MCPVIYAVYSLYRFYSPFPSVHCFASPLYFLSLFCQVTAHEMHLNTFCLTMSIDLGLQVGQAIPEQDWTGPHGSTGIRCPDFQTIGT
jgi:hypothetical protein